MLKAERDRIVRAMRNAWLETVKRCTNPRHAQYKYYGGRGIRVCRRWLRFENYLEDTGLRPKGLTLDRRNNNKGYSPSNCRWASRSVQSQNQRRAVYLKLGSKILSLQAWADVTGISYGTLKARQYLGYSDKDILTKPVQCGARLQHTVN